MRTGNHESRARPDDRARSLAEYAIQVIREDLVSGRLAPGSRIQADQLASSLEMSPIPVREALRSLASEGLVVPLPQRGFRVPQVSLADLEDTYRIRRALDALAIELVAPHLTSPLFSELDAALDGLAATNVSGDWEEPARFHREFHFIIYRAAESPWLMRLMSMVWGNSERYWRLSNAQRGGSPRQNAEAHRRILDALRAGDLARATEHTRDHLELTLRTIRRALEEHLFDPTSNAS